MSGGHAPRVHVRKPHASLSAELWGAVSEPAVSEAGPAPEELATPGQKQDSESMVLGLS